MIGLLIACGVGVVLVGIVAGWACLMTRIADKWYRDIVEREDKK